MRMMGRLLPLIVISCRRLLCRIITKVKQILRSRKRVPCSLKRVVTCILRLRRPMNSLRLLRIVLVAVLILKWVRRSRWVRLIIVGNLLKFVVLLLRCVECCGTWCRLVSIRLRTLVGPWLRRSMSWSLVIVTWLLMRMILRLLRCSWVRWLICRLLLNRFVRLGSLLLVLVMLLVF